jgi:hypothetical protein
VTEKQLLAEAMRLPLDERVSLAQALWQNIDSELSDSEGRTGMREAVTRDRELSAGTTSDLNHNEAMEIARGALGSK